MSTRRMLRGALCMVVAMLLAQATIVAPTWAQSGEYTDIYVLGQRATTFSPAEWSATPPTERLRLP